MPLVIVFTKFDLVSSSHDYESHCRSLFRNVPAEIVSSIYYFVCTAQKGCLTPSFIPAQSRFRDRVNKLVETTEGVIIAHLRNIPASSEAQRTQPQLFPVSLAWSVSQRANRGINIKAAIECVFSLLRLDLLS